MYEVCIITWHVFTLRVPTGVHLGGPIVTYAWVNTINVSCDTLLAVPTILFTHNSVHRTDCLPTCTARLVSSSGVGIILPARTIVPGRSIVAEQSDTHKLELQALDVSRRNDRIIGPDGALECLLTLAGNTVWRALLRLVQLVFAGQPSYTSLKIPIM